MRGAIRLNTHKAVGKFSQLFAVFDYARYSEWITGSRTADKKSTKCPWARKNLFWLILWNTKSELPFVVCILIIP